MMRFDVTVRSDAHGFHAHGLSSDEAHSVEFTTPSFETEAGAIEFATRWVQRWNATPAEAGDAVDVSTHSIDGSEIADD